MGILKNSNGGSAIRDIGYDKFFIHFWSDLQLKIYKDYCTKNKSPTICFDATGGCCKKIKRYNDQISNAIFLYEGVMEINNQSFTALSMLSERHDNISISLWLKRWLRHDIKPPKTTVSDQSIALMSGIAQTFTQYNSLEKYLEVCFNIIQGKNNETVPKCFIRNDINHFVHLVTQWVPIKISKYPRTKDLFSRAMGALIVCTTIDEAKRILEAIFTIAFSRYDGLILNSDIETPCAKSKKFLQSRITSSINHLFESEINSCTQSENLCIQYEKEVNDFDCAKSFKDWAKSISTRCKLDVENKEGQYDNAQYLPELENNIINAMKLFPCWSAIMVYIFDEDEVTVSSARVESNFNQLKNRLFKTEILPVRVDEFINKILPYYNGDHLLQQGAFHDNELSSSSTSENSAKIITPNVHNNKNNCEDVTIISNRLPSLKTKETYNLILEKDVNKISCIACTNGDFPTGLHCCVYCKKAVHLFGCSVPALNTAEGCGEKRICLDCNQEDNNTLKENKTFENWKGQGEDRSYLYKKRSSNSYLERQPGFEYIDLNRKGSVPPILFLKNGSLQNNKPIYINGVGKILLSNTCSADSLFTILATSAADSILYNNFLYSVNETNKTVNFVLKMIKDGKVTNQAIIKYRTLLLLKHFEKTIKLLIGGIKLVDSMTTIATLIRNLLKELPSYVQINECTNEICTEKITNEKFTVISLNAFGGKINLQQELDNFFLTNYNICSICNQDRNIIMKPMNHLLIELNAVPQGKKKYSI